MINLSKLAVMGLLVVSPILGSVAHAHGHRDGGGTAVHRDWSTTEMSCVEARETVKSYGAIVLSTGGDRYDRYVNTMAYCDRAKDEMVPAWVPTADSNQCFIGWTCEWAHNE